MKHGFTLIEILIVIAIIGMIVGLLLPNFNQLRQGGRDQARKTGVKALVEALEMYKLNQNPPAYPETATMLLILNTGNVWTENGITYLNQTPVDPLYDTDPNKFKYIYVRTTPQTYYVGDCLEDASDSEGRPSPNPAFDNSYCDSDLWYYKTEP